MPAALMPLPPYIKPRHERRSALPDVFAHAAGAVAAPTAGFISPRKFLSEIPHTFVTLHVDRNILPVRQTTSPASHAMRSARFHKKREQDQQCAPDLAVERLPVRTLESPDAKARSCGAKAQRPLQSIRLIISRVDALLPIPFARSTLLML